MKTYTKEFKQDAINYVESHPAMTMETAANYLNMPKETLYGWVKAYRRQQRAGSNEPLTGPMTDEEKEIARLKRELRDAQDAVEILKKAISILNNK